MSSAQPLLANTRRRPRAARARTDETGEARLPGWRVGKLFPTSSLGGTGWGGVSCLGSSPPDPGIGCRSGSPPGPAAFFICEGAPQAKPRRNPFGDGRLLQLEGADSVAVGGLVSRVHAVRKRLDQAHQSRVRADVRGPVRRVVEHQLRVL